MMHQRIVGQSKKDRVKPLLSTFKSTPETTGQTKMEPVKDIFAPPNASSDESDDGSPIQKDMKKTKFERKRSRSPERGSQRTKRSRTTADSTRASGGRRNIRPASFPGRPQTSQGETEAKHLTDPSGFVGPRSKAKHTFGKGSQRSSQNSAPRSSAPQESSKRPEFVKHSMSISPSVSPEKAGPKSGLIVHSPIKSPSQTPIKRKSRTLDLSPDSSPTTSKVDGSLGNQQGAESKSAKVSSKSNGKQQPTFKVPTLDELDELSGLSSSSDDEIIEKERDQGNIVKVEAKKLPGRPVFKVPELEGLGSIADHMGGKEVLSTQQLGYMNSELLDENSKSDLSSDDDFLGTPGRQRPSITAHCPMCGQTVDSELLKRHTTHGRMTIRQQTNFCQSHKRKEAEEARKCNRYPVVDWEGLEARFTEHKDFIRGILEGKRPSHFASLLSNKIEVGKDRTLLKTDESLTPGYYGPRGLRYMTEFIMHSFSDTVRKRAVEDRLVSARTYTGYVQSVLVPELAVRLIMEDMNVDEEGARKIMQESSSLGDVLHEETRDVVVRDSDDED